jgi:hypothetical protein
MSEEKSIAGLKVVNVKFETAENGTIKLQFKKAVDTENTNQLICEYACPYGKLVASTLADPTEPNDPESCFCDFCNSLGEQRNKTGQSDPEIYSGLVPVEGTLEENLPDFKDYYLKLNRRNPLVRLDAVIDTVCDGICEFYCKDHSQCTVANGDCFLMDLMKEQKRVEQENKRIEEEARKKAEEEAESESDV